MATKNSGQLRVYGLNRGGIFNEFPVPVTALRDPGAADFKPPFTLWRNIVTPSAPKVWVFAGSNAGAAIWQLLEASGAAGVFSSLTVTPGPISLTGTTTINTSGAANTNIGTATNTGIVSIGNATGNTFIPAGNLTATLGNIVASAGNISATLGSLSSGTTVTAGTGINATTGNIAALAGGLRATTAGATTGLTSDTSAGTGVSAILTSANATTDALQLVGGGIKVAPVIPAAGASPRVASGRFGVVAFTDVIVAGGENALAITNTMSTAASQVMATVQCATVDSPCVIRNIDVSVAGTITCNVINLGGTNTGADVVVTFWLLN